MNDKNILPADSGYWETQYSISDIISNRELPDNDTIARFAFAKDVKVKEKRVSKAIFKLRDTAKYPDEKAMSMQHVEINWNETLVNCLNFIKGTTHHVKIKVSDIRNLDIIVSNFSFEPQDNLDKKSALAKLECNTVPDINVKSNVLPSPSQTLPHHVSLFLYADKSSSAILTGKFYGNLAAKNKDIIQGSLAKTVHAIYDNQDNQLQDFVCC